MGTQFRVDAEQVGGKVTVDGRDVTEHVMATELVVDPDQPTRLILHLRAQGVVEGEGVVETVRTVASGDAVRGLNAQQVEAEALRRLQMGGSLPTLRLQVIAELLDQAGP